jgi:hypothetical protein
MFNNTSFKKIKSIFFPKGIREKYRYLGSVPWREEGDIAQAMLPLVLLLDHKAKPYWCPRWVLRLLNELGCGGSLVRVRNRTAHNLFVKLTKGYMIWDYKTKWSNYDLRISITGDENCWFLTNAIENAFYTKGRKEELVEQILELDPTCPCHGWNTEMLLKKLEELENGNSEYNS